ncbi:SPTY2D1 [Branchiostoma lanceolatum]|uniref:Protein SPT2 homolog n=1 Tax=Branchiostoma lanceolatum TaxID=7740 RepID=A0A8J9ZKK4_BRALA|nr:SPTY2D1 [Branchiostoma lanceolatum]
MNFEDLLNIAAQKQKNAEKELSTTKRYSTAAKPAKKIVKPKPKSVQSAAIRALMEKKHEEEKKRATEAKKRMDEAQDVLNKKRKKTDIVKSLASANTSSKTEKPQDKKTKEEKYESKEHKAKHMQFMQKVSKLKTPREDVEKKRTDFKRPPDRPIPKKKAPPPPSKPMSFQDLMKMAEKKKDEPVPLPKIHEELFGADSDDEVEEVEKEEPRYVYHSKGRYLDTKGSEPGSSSAKSKSRHQNDKSRGSGSKSSNDTHKSSSTSKSDASKRPSSSTHNGTNKSVTSSKQVVHPNNRRGEVQDSTSRSVSGSASKPKCTLVVESLPSRLTTGPPRQPPPRRGYEDMRRGMKRRYDDSEEESDDFIDDSNEDVDYSKYIREIFGYDKRKYRYESDREIASMESNFRQVMQEEARSARLAIQEDADELRKAAEEEKRKQPRSKGKQRK